MRKEDILKSYSKVHSRELRLLEQGEEEILPEEESLQSRTSAAVRILNGLTWTQRTPTEDGTGSWQAVVDAGVPNKSGKTTRDLNYNTGTGKLSGTPPRFQAQVVAQGIPAAGTSWVQDLGPSLTARGDAQQQFKQLLGQLVGDTEVTKSKSQRDIEDKIRPGGALDQIDDVFDPEITKQIRANLESISESLGPVWEGMSEENHQAYQNTIANFQKEFVGSSKRSFESKLLTDKTQLALVNGEWVSTTKSPTALQSLSISESVKDLVSLASTDNPSPEQCENITRDFAIQAGTDRIIISPKGDGDDRVLALSFADPKKTLRNTLIRASRNCQPSLEDAEDSIKKVRVQAIDESEGGKGDNAARGFAFEDILEVFSLIQIKKGMQGEASEEFNNVLINKSMKVQDRLKKLKASSEQWVEAIKAQGLNPAQAQLIQEVYQLASDIGDFNPQTLFASMMYHSKNSLVKRKPSFIFPVGTETKRGKRQDVLEVYKTREEALAAAASMGVELEPEEYSSLDDALRGEVGILSSKGDQLKLSTILENAGAFDANVPVYTIKVSLKNYMKFEGEGALMGGGMKSTFPTLLTATGSEFDEPFMQKIQEIANIDNVQEFKKYSYKLQAISRKINALGDTTYTKSGRIKTDNLKNLSVVVRAAVKENNLDMTAAGKSLQKSLETFQRRVKISGLGDSEYIRAKEYTSRYLESFKLFGDLDSENTNTSKLAKQYLAAQMLHAGGSDDDETLCDYRGLNSDEDYIFKQNDPLKDAWKSVISGEKDPKGNSWNIKTDLQTGKYELVMEGNSKIKITFVPQIIPRKSGGQVVGYATQFQTRLNKSALRYFNKMIKSQTEQTKVNEAFRHAMLALSLIQEKVNILDVQ